MNINKVLGYKWGIAFVRKSLEEDDGLKHWLRPFPECFLGRGWGQEVGGMHCDSQDTMWSCLQLFNVVVEV